MWHNLTPGRCQVVLPVMPDIRWVMLCLIAIGSPALFPILTFAQSPSLPPDQVRQLTERLDALESENAAVRADNSRLESFIRGRFPDFAKGATGGACVPGSLQSGMQTRFQITTEQNAVPSSMMPAGKPDSRFLEGVVNEKLVPRYDNGFVLMESSDSERMPFRLVAGNFAQIRYTNTQLDSLTYVDHLGNVRPVDPRNDISFNRDLLTFSGYAYDPSLKYNIIVWSSGSLASVVVAGGITYEYSKAFALSGGYNGLPGSRSMLGGFKELEGLDRSMADTFFRPGFTQGVWATGEPVDSVFYNVMIGNSLNTLQINASKIDVNMAYSGSVWWEPWGSYGVAYNDLEKHANPAIRLGSCFTRAREDRFSDESVATPDNVQLYNSDGVLFFSTGAFAPGVTVLLADYTMWAIDAGYKYNGFAMNGQYFFRWLNNFRTDGPVPIDSTFDNGFEASIGYFFHPKVELYARTSFVFGQFQDSHEYCGGFNWYPYENRGLRVCGEVGRVDSSPVGNIITPYQAGMSGWMFLLQAQLNF
ncbi:MAG TPA: hypothetical protein PLN21_10110 [Gemmatales bacterium]|nr:hypothetical protein [Gemmatales bacterium]